ncbi:MAG: hypothetical protein OR994_04875 [Candidatus Poseidoniales archaeon]|nr:hypothetical protein [Candidatus Poseidoniales archaeon]
MSIMEGFPSTDIGYREYIGCDLDVNKFCNTNIICALGSKSQFTWLRL